MPDNDMPITGAEAGGPVLPGAPANSGQPAATPANPPIDWQKRYGGLQESLNKHYQRTGFKALDEIPDAQTWASWRQAADQLAGLQQKQETLAKTHQDLQAEYELRQSQLSGLNAQRQKLQLLAEKYPSLGRFHANIETLDTLEAQEQAIQTFQAALQGYLGAQAQGAPPPPGGGIPAGGSATLEDEVKSAWAEYNQAVSGAKPRDEIARLFSKYAALDARYHKERGIPDKYAAPRARSVE